MPTTSSEDEFEYYGRSTVAMLDIASCKSKDIIAKEADCTYAERTNADVPTRIQKTLAHTFRLDNSAAWSGIKMASVLFLETAIANLFSRDAADDIQSDYIEPWTESEEFMYAFVERPVSRPLSTPLVVGFIKQYVTWSIDECRLAQLYVVTRKIDKKRVRLPLNRSVSDTTEHSENTRKRESSNHPERKK